MYLLWCADARFVDEWTRRVDGGPSQLTGLHFVFPHDVLRNAAKVDDARHAVCEIEGGVSEIWSRPTAGGVEVGMRVCEAWHEVATAAVNNCRVIR